MEKTIPSTQISDVLVNLVKENQPVQLACHAEILFSEIAVLLKVDEITASIYGAVRYICFHDIAVERFL